MTVVTFRLDEDVVDELDTEAEAQGYGSRAAYIRHIIDQRDRGGDLEQRVERLEEAVAELRESSR